ncbi:MAG: hypothetical protein IT172_08825 [Acidobacteria bacterium]|nr:hypothetical protein [Acidobacteriota bacterium]
MITSFLMSDLGKTVSIHPIQPAIIQRAVFIGVLSFMFFLAMMLAFYLRQNIGYFLLASAFLVIYVVMMFSFAVQRKTVVTVCANGIKFKRHRLLWTEILAIDERGVLMTNPGGAVALPRSVAQFDRLVSVVRANIGRQS